MIIMDKTMENGSLYRDWLNLIFHLLWCYDQPLASHPKDHFIYKNNGAWLVREGWAEVKHAGQVWRATPGQWLIVKPVERIQRWSSNVRLLSVAFDAQWPDGTPLISEGLTVVLEGKKYPELERRALQMVRIMKKVVNTGWDARDHRIDFNGYMRLQACLSLWLTSLSEALRDHGLRLDIRQNIDERVMQTVRLINSQSYAEPVNINVLSRQVGISAAHLTRLFKEHLHITPAAYQNQLRVEQARRRLHVPGVRIKEIAIELGFLYLSHFSRWFKQNAGISPRQFKETIDNRRSRQQSVICVSNKRP